MSKAFSIVQIETLLRRFLKEKTTEFHYLDVTH